MGYQFSELCEADRTAVVKIFNYFVEHSFAAYPDECVSEDWFDRVLAMAKGYPAATVRDEDGTVVGFGFLRAFLASTTLRRTAEVGYFLLPEHTGKGVGQRMLAKFIEEARALGVDNLVASVSSLNEQSLRFHKRTGFEWCGTFRAVGRKFGRDFDIVYFQKKI